MTVRKETPKKKSERSALIPNIKCTPEMREAFDELAESAELPLAAYVRRVLSRHLATVKGGDI